MKAVVETRHYVDNNFKGTTHRLRWIYEDLNGTKYVLSANKRFDLKEANGRFYFETYAKTIIPVRDA